MQVTHQAQFATDASGASWWPNLQLVQVAPPGGQKLQTMDETSNGGKVVYNVLILCIPDFQRSIKSASLAQAYLLWWTASAQVHISDLPHINSTVLLGDSPISLLAIASSCPPVLCSSGKNFGPYAVLTKLRSLGMFLKAWWLPCTN